jgi:hypothetical protein
MTGPIALFDGLREMYLRFWIALSICVIRTLLLSVVPC